MLARETRQPFLAAETVQGALIGRALMISHREEPMWRRYSLKLNVLLSRQILIDRIECCDFHDSGKSSYSVSELMESEIRMSRDLEQLLAAARLREFPPSEREAQRRSFAYGNTHIENSRITRETIDEQAEVLKIQGDEAH